MKNFDNDNELDSFQPLSLAAERLVKSLSQSQELAVGAGSSHSELSGSLFDRGERAQAFDAVAKSDFCVEPPIRANVNALKASGRPGLAVASILLSSSLPQIDDAVIVLPAVDVIQDRTGPFAVHEEPCEAVGKVADAVNANNSIPVANAARTFSVDLAAKVFPDYPSENSGILAVIEEFANTFQRDITFALSHGLENSKNHHPDSERDASENTNESDKTADHRKAVEHGLRQIERFERRYRRSDRP